MVRQNRLVKASFYKKEGTMLWIMYFLFFIIGYFYGRRFDYVWDVCILFVIMLIIIIIFGKKEENDVP